jgi:outer membrane receptor protein involved in Fe transport
MANFRLAVELNDHLELSFFVDNIFDERPQYYFFRNDEPGLLPDDLRESTITSAPRTFGLSARYRR